MGTLPPFVPCCLCDTHPDGALGLEAAGAAVPEAAPVCTAQPASRVVTPQKLLPPSPPAKGTKRLGIHSLKQIFSVQISYSGVVNPLVMGLEYITALRLEPDRLEEFGVNSKFQAVWSCPQALRALAGTMAPPCGD